MNDLVYRKVEQNEVYKILRLAKDILEFPLGSEDKILKNWSNIEAIGGFSGENLLSLLITDPYNPVRWTPVGKTSGEKAPGGKNYIKTAFLLQPIISSELMEHSEAITMKLMDAYFDNMSFCDELILYTTAEPGENKRRKLLGEIGFISDGKFPKKMVFRSDRHYFLEKKLSKILSGIKTFLQKTGLPYAEIDKNLIYTELLNVIIYILVDEYRDEHSIIKFFGYLAALPEINTEIIRYLLELNYYSSYGSFCVDADCNVLVINSKLGPSLDERDIELSLKSIVLAISRYTEDVVSKFGGESLFYCILNKKPKFPGNYRYLLEENDI